MSFEQCRNTVITSTNIRDFFRDSVTDAMSNQGIDAEVETAIYLVNVLTAFTRSEEFFDICEDKVGLRPLALHYADALSGSTAEHRHRSLQRLGDVALFMAGVFAENLNNKIVDLDYYVAMGRNAYSYLADSLKGTYRGTSFCDIFAELAEKFVPFVDVLAEVSENAAMSKDDDILRLYETWIRTGSVRSWRKLRALGIEPSQMATVSHQ